MLTLEQLLMMADAVNATEAGARAETATVIWIQVALLVYLAGIVFFAFRNVYSLVRLLMLLKSGKKEDIGSYLPGRKERVTLIVHNCDIAPFSWMGYIVISRKDLEENGREILIHELAISITAIPGTCWWLMSAFSFSGSTGIMAPEAGIAEYP